VATVLLTASVVVGVWSFHTPAQQDGVNRISDSPAAGVKARFRVTNTLLRFEYGGWTLSPDEIVSVAVDGKALWLLQRPLGPRVFDRRIVGLWPVGGTYPRWSGPSAAVLSFYAFDPVLDGVGVSSRQTWYAEDRDTGTSKTLSRDVVHALGTSAEARLAYAADANARHRRVLELVTLPPPGVAAETSMEGLRASLSERMAGHARDLQSLAGDSPDGVHDWWHDVEDEAVDLAGLALALDVSEASGRAMLAPVAGLRRTTMREWVSAHSSVERVLAWEAVADPSVATDEQVEVALDELEEWAGPRAIEWVVLSKTHSLRDHPVVVRNRARLEKSRGDARRSSTPSVFPLLLLALALPSIGVWWWLRRQGLRLAPGTDERERYLHLSLLIGLALACLHVPLWLRIHFGDIGLALAAVSCWHLGSPFARRAALAFAASAAIQPVSEWTGLVSLDAASRALAFVGVALVVLDRRPVAAPDAVAPPRRAALATWRTALQHLLVGGVTVALLRELIGHDWTESRQIGQAVWLVMAVLAGALLVLPRRSPHDAVLRVPLVAYALAVGVSAHAVTWFLTLTGSSIDHGVFAPPTIGAGAAAVLLAGLTIRILFRARLRARVA